MRTRCNSTSRTRCSRAPASPATERPRNGPPDRARDPRPRRLRGLRGHLQGPEHAAYAADERHQRDPRHRPARRAAGDRSGRRGARGHPRRDRDRVRHDQRRRRLPRHRPHARDVQVEAGGAARARMSRADFIQLLYIVAFAMFIAGLHMLRGPRTAVRGNQVAAVGMAIAVVATLIDQRIGDWGLIVVGLVIGTAVGVPAARSVRMTAMPQMVALFNGVGGGAVALISVVEYKESLEADGNPELEALIPILFAAIIGSISFWGSNVAFLKLQETLKGRFAIPRAVNAALALIAIGLAVVIAAGAESQLLFWLILLAAGALGVLAVLPIGGADMPVVISTLNAFTGLSAAAAGVALDNTALIVAGMLVGASGSILTRQMAEAMNRS